MDSFHFGSALAAQHPQPKSEDAMDIPFSSFDDDQDHRKRRRNRTTQSCWSCHQAKRKCDRKRPCSRCIQLGLTGLCVYETDDPASRDDPSLSETQRLRKRIAELEALVREMKNKPHPRWADKVSSAGGIGVDKWHTRAKYVVGSNGAPTSADAFDDYQYRFPPLENGGGGGYDSFSPSSSSSTVLPPPPFDDSRRLSIASSVSSNSSPRTPYSYSVGTGILANPCGCLSAAPNTARALASAIRQVVLESGITHPYSEGCKVLALVRELETAANESSPTSHNHTSSAAAAASMYYPPPPDPHSNSNSPHPPSSSGSSPHSHPIHQLPHPLQITPPTPLPTVTSHRSQQQPQSQPHISYANYPMAYSYHSPGSDDSNGPPPSQQQQQQQQQPALPTVPSMAPYSGYAGVDYHSDTSANNSPSKNHGYALAGVV